MKSIERDSPVPLYYQLQQLLGERIASGELQPGDMFPTEEQLQDAYQLSRTTVRQALKELELEGLVSRQRGRGTFVIQPKIEHRPEPQFSLTEALLRQGIQPGWHVLSAEWIPSSTDIATTLELEPGTPVFQLRRLRLMDDEPIGYHIAHAAPATATAIDKEQINEGGSLRYLHGNDTLDGSYANRTLEAIGATAEVAGLLNVEEGSPILLIRRKVVDRDDHIIEVLQAMYRGDRMQYHVRQGPDVKQG